MRITDAIRERLNGACWRRLNLTWRLRSGVEILVRSRAEWVIYNDIFVEGEYDPALERVLRNAPSGRPINVLDLGANVGYFSLRVIDRAAALGFSRDRLRLALVEGSPRVFAELERRIGANRQDAAVTLVNGLVGQRCGAGRISDGTFHVENALIPDAGGQGVPVPFVDIESLYPAPQIVGLLKCDIEGSEQAFIEHYPALLARVACAVFELHPMKCDMNRCVALLAQAGLQRTVLVRETSAFSVQVFENASLRGAAGNDQ